MKDELIEFHLIFLMKPHDDNNEENLVSWALPIFQKAIFNNDLVCIR